MKTKITLNAQTLELLGLLEKDLDVYIAVLKLGSAPLRKVAEQAGLSRTTAYDALGRLSSAGLLSSVDAKTHRYYVAQDPQKLRALATQRELALEEARQTIDTLLPSLRELAGTESHRPAVRYFEGEVGVKEVLEDVLFTTGKNKIKTYRVYSSSGLRDLIATSWPRFSAKRKALGIHVKAISMDEGGQTVGLDERKWLSRAKGGAPTYIFIYGGKTAYVAIDKNRKLFCAVIDDIAITSTQQMIFDALWNSLG